MKNISNGSLKSEHSDIGGLQAEGKRLGGGSIRRISVVGAGTMGHGIAELSILSGYETVLIDVKEELLASASEKIRWSLEKFKERGKMKEEVSVVLSRLSSVTDIGGGVSAADFIIEAVPETLSIKHDVFRIIDRSARPGAILATNTSSLPITEIGRVTGRPDWVIGMHFFNPVPLMPLVEITKGNMTSDTCVSGTYDLARSMGKEPVIVRKDVTGFIVNRIVGRLYLAACRLVSRGEATVEEVDATLKYGLGFPMGAFELADFSGIDVIYFMLQAMSERGYLMHPCNLYKEKFDAKELGVKSGKGFYVYPDAKAKPRIPQEKAGSVDPLALIAPVINEAAWLISNGVATGEDIDKAFVKGLGYPKGLFSYIDDLGIENIIGKLESMSSESGWKEYEPEPYLRSIHNK